MAKLGKALRAKLRARLPGLLEVVYVYENQNALVIAYSPTEKGYEAPCSFALYPDGVKLYFTQSPLLSKSDPNKLLRGSGTKVRYVVLNAMDDFQRAEIQSLMAAALKHANLRPDASANSSVIIKAEEQKQRARVARIKRRGRPWLRITVEDDGPGIPEAWLRTVFEQFRQVDGTITRSHGGMGIGLATAKSLAEAMAGRLTSANHAGGGSTFSLLLPPA